MPIRSSSSSATCTSTGTCPAAWPCERSGGAGLGAGDVHRDSAAGAGPLPRLDSRPAGAGCASRGTDHGIQSDRPAPGLAPLQAVADRMLPQKVELTDLAQVVEVPVSMRLAAQLPRGERLHRRRRGPHPSADRRAGNEHRHSGRLQPRVEAGPCVPGDGPNRCSIATRRSGGLSARRWSQARPGRANNSGVEKGPPDRLAETQVRVNYRTSAWVGNGSGMGAETKGPIAGDSVPDCHGLRRDGLGFPLRLFDILRGHPRAPDCSICPELTPPASWRISPGSRTRRGFLARSRRCAPSR